MRRLAAAALVLLVCAAPASAAPRKSFKKGMWGPVAVDGVSQFPIYRSLGAGILSLRLPWYEVARTRPADPRNPADPAYAWPAEIDAAFREAAASKMRIALDVRGAPPWANGGREPNWVPGNVADYRNFVTAAVKRYPQTRYWVIWAEPTRKPNYMPLVTEKGPAVRLDAERRRAPHYYARMLDAAYRAIKSVRRQALVVGGNSFVGGDISPYNWIRNLKLPNGKPPRMDLYGHHPFTARRPDLRKPPIQKGLADFSDLDTLAGWVDRHLGRRPGGGRIKLFLGEWSLATDHANNTFNIWVTRATQASWLRSALRIVRRWKRIEALVWIRLYDQPPRPDGRETNFGLLDWQGGRKPAFDVFARG
jgi:hypothetical protein